MHGEYKVPGGKLVVVDLDVTDGRISGFRLAGDFFLEPDDALEAIDGAVNGLPEDSDANAIAAAIRRALPPQAVLLGFSPEAVAVAIRRSLARATNWGDYEWEVIHDRAYRPVEQMALDQVLAEEVGAGRRNHTLRSWEWEQPAVVIGSFQSLRNEVDAEQAAAHGFDVVRRVSGGGAMYMEAGAVITYSIYAPVDLVQGMTFADSYAYLDEWVITALRSLGHRRVVPAAQRHHEPHRQDRRRRAEAPGRGRRAAPRHHELRHGRREDGAGAPHRPREDQRQGHHQRRQARGSAP